MKEHDALLAWYQTHKREMPWRSDPTPYHVYLSEIMLQQTRVEAVRPYYARFLDEIPTFAELSKVDDDRLMKLWQGLGYYSRARNLKKCAQEAMVRFGGELPHKKEELKTLPGIGEYTASAIASIAYQEKEVAVDGNLLRVYARLECDATPIDEAAIKQRCDAYFRNWMKDIDRPGDLNQALMDLGEMVCLPNGAPKCEECPLKEFCKAHKEGSMLKYPTPKAQLRRKPYDLYVFLLKKGDAYLIHKRPEKGLLSGLYEFPNIEKGPLFPNDALKRLNIEATDLQLGSIKKHIFTHLEWTMHVVTGEVVSFGDSYILAKEQELEERYSLPSAFAKLLPRK